ncbi:Rha family transcriptional regulator [Pseudomonas guariconensis]|uniref:Rha family transcriptional regulator n=1 Tax=Pseudomonas guariconensis TaxID=1288410 RepID=UPI0025A956A7|nr:Rha family transcriptional regulator [Pseudomonas guariconensis]MDM9595330.1 Rha family transcriptional regulator [Pseudomonas guariconensis]MDM9608160.1 Rha family transcriptional regulator [Pseudomonas guariconensis]MDM9613117.1 Rha family transcriptional regulator [Pseudomonas guariconensis]
MNLVTIKDGDAVTPTTAIAAGTENEHASVIALVRKYHDDLCEFGRVRFEVDPFETAGGMQTREIALLTEPQATLLLTYMRNTEIVRAFKKKLVREFWELVQERNRASQPDVTTQEGALIALQGAVEKQLALIAENRQIAQQRDEAVRTKAEIGTRREATAMATASAAVRQVQKLKEELGLGIRQASVVAVEKATGRNFGTAGYVPLRKWCTARGITAPKVIHPTFGTVRSWPAGAWMDVYQIDLAELFGTPGETA